MDPLSRTDSPERRNPYIYGQFNLDESYNNLIVFSTKCTRKTGYLHAKGYSWTPSSHCTQKITQMDQTPKCKSQNDKNSYNEP